MPSNCQAYLDAQQHLIEKGLCHWLPNSAHFDDKVEKGATDELEKYVYVAVVFKKVVDLDHTWLRTRNEAVRHEKKIRKSGYEPVK
jgi:hypothetical protein